MQFQRDTVRNQYNFIVNIWSDYTLRGDYLWREPLNCYWIVQAKREISFFSQAVFNRSTYCTSWLWNMWKLKRRWSGYSTLLHPLPQFFYSQCPGALFFIDLSIKVHFQAMRECVFVCLWVKQSELIDSEHMHWPLCALGKQSCWYFATPCIIRLRGNKDVGSTNSVCLDQDDSSIQDPREQWLFHKTPRERDPVEGPAKVFVKGWVSLGNNKERNSEE